MLFPINSDLPSSPMEQAQVAWEFPKPSIDLCTCITARVYYPSQNEVMMVDNVLVPTEQVSNNTITADPGKNSSSSSSSSRNNNSGENTIMEDNVPVATKKQSFPKAYCLQRMLLQEEVTTFVRVYHGIVLKKAPIGEKYDWIVTNEECTVKKLSWDYIRDWRNRGIAENPLTEIAAMQYLKQFFTHRHWQDTHLLTPMDIWSDTSYLYMVLPFCHGDNTILSEVQIQTKFSEEQSRNIFHQLLVGVSHLQQAGVCHRDLSLENCCLLHRSSTTVAVIIDFGMCLKIPYQRNPTVNTPAAASSNSSQDVVLARDVVDYRNEKRCWIVPSGSVGNLGCRSPEIVANTTPFDGYAVDIWACGVILFIMTTGFPPWEIASPITDENFLYMSSEYTVQCITDWNLDLSQDLKDLFLRMFWLDPKERFCLQQILQHPWMTNHQQ